MKIEQVNLDHVPLRHIVGITGLIIDGDWVESKDQDPEGDVRLIQLADIGVGNFLDRSSRFMTRNKANQLRCTFLHKGDILVARMPDPIGRACQFPGASHPCVTVVDVCVLRTDNDVADPRYVTHILNSSGVKNKLDKFVKGATRQRISRTNLEQIPIPFPSLPEQRRIAAILDQAVALRIKRREALAQLDNLTQSIFIEMFGNLINNYKGWKRCSVGDVTDCIVPGRDKPKSFTGNIPWVTTDDLIHLDFTYRSTKGLGLSASEISGVKARVIPANSVIISCVGNLGITTIAAEKMVINQQLHSFQCHEQVNNIYLMHCLAKQKAFMYAKASSTTLPYMNKSVCNSIPVQIPPIELQREFSSRVLAINGIKERHQIFLAELDALFASLQHRAFRGEL